MSPILICFIGICVLLLLIALRIPIAFSLAIVGLAGSCAVIGTEVAFKATAVNSFGAIKNWLLVAVPLFIAMGNFAQLAGISTHAYDVSDKWLSRMPGGLAVASVFACALFAATSGSSVATAGLMGAVAIPEMLKYGYSKRLATGCVAARRSTPATTR